jgi:hypothetical protein
MEVRTRTRAFLVTGPQSQATELSSLSTTPAHMCSKSHSTQNPPKSVCNSMIQKEILVFIFCN